MTKTVSIKDVENSSFACTNVYDRLVNICEYHKCVMIVEPLQRSAKEAKETLKSTVEKLKKAEDRVAKVQGNIKVAKSPLGLLSIPHSLLH